MSSAEYHRNYYHSKVNKSRKIELQSQRKKSIKKKVQEYLKVHPCVDCGNSDIRVLEFDHVRGQKENTISDAIKNGHSWTRVESEIEKCEVRCANCHRIRHYKT